MLLICPVDFPIIPCAPWEPIWLKARDLRVYWLSYSVDAVKGTPVTTAAGCGACTGSSCSSTQVAAQRWTGTTSISNPTQELTTSANKSPHGMCYSKYGRDHNLHDIVGYFAPEVNQNDLNES